MWLNKSINNKETQKPPVPSSSAYFAPSYASRDQVIQLLLIINYSIQQLSQHHLRIMEIIKASMAKPMLNNSTHSHKLTRLKNILQPMPQ